MRYHFLQRARIVVSAVIAIAAGSLSAGESLHCSLGGYGHWQVGQVVKGSATSLMDHQWINSGLLGLTITVNPTKRLTINVSPEFKQFFPYPMLHTIGARRQQAVSYINEMNFNIALGDVENPFAEILGGVLNYKYNPDARDFGEYIFRTGTYPPFVINNFDYAKARICGLFLRLNPVPDLKVDALLTTELQYYPLYDFSLSFFTEYKLLNAFNFGAGVNFARLISVDESRTSPTEVTAGGAAFESIHYIKPNSDTGLYSFRATKLMARLNVDPLGFFPDWDFFGKEDLKIYGEVALTGLPIKSVPDSAHPDLYGDISRLMPIMGGVNPPVFKALDLIINYVVFNDDLWALIGIDVPYIPIFTPQDVFSFEAEYFPSRMANDYYDTFDKSVPLPVDFALNPKSYIPENYAQRDWGWAFYASKEVMKGLSLVGLIAYDHMRMPFTDGYESTMECMNKKGDWAWQMKTKVSF